MKLLTLLIPLNVVMVSLAAIGALTAKGEQPSTLFVLDTSDSDSVPTNKELDSTPETNTKIISDASASGHSATGGLKQNQNNNSQRSTTATNASGTNHSNQHNQQQATHYSQEHQSHNQTPTSSRRLEEPARVAPIPKVATISQQQPGGSHLDNNNQRHKTTTSIPQDSDHTNESHAPKTEERLLISITSEDPDEPYKKVSTGSEGSGDSLNVPLSSNTQQVHHHQKRKPSITISIQDANHNKQNGGSGTQAVIVRPGEDGQSIVIATVGSSSNSNSNNNNSNKYKPTQATMSNENEGINMPMTSVSQRPPYNEPVNNPIQGIIAQHQITSTTRRPLINNDYNPPNQNRPITSTLIDQQRPPIQVIDERPQRPVQSGLDERPVTSSYETPRPIRPTSESYNGNNNNNNQDTEPSSTGDQYQGGQGDEQRKYPLNEKNCGVMHETRIVGGEEADPDDFMWMVAIIKSRPNNGEPRPFCGGSLITRRHILTAAHCLEGLAPRDVLVRLGSYDFEDSASSSSADYAIDQFRVPAQYSKKTHAADIAIMRLKTPLSTNDQYKTVCMPQPRRSYVGAFGLVTGYGSQSQTFRKAAPKLRQVTVPIWENRKCSKVYNKTMTDSFLCAGYEEGGKDACQGDSGGPLMTEGPEQKMMIVGVVSHGIGCGAPGYPGVYTRTTTYNDWIEKNTRE